MPRPYAYASAPDVLAHLPFFRSGHAQATLTATSVPNATQVHDYLIGVSDELDAVLAGKNYSVPVATTASGASDLLNHWAAIGAAAHAAAALPQGSDGKHLQYLERRWTAILNNLSDGVVTLPDATRDTNVSRPRYAARSADEGASPYFTRAMHDGV